MEQDACSSCSSFPPLESSNDTEIVTISKDCVPGVPSEIQSTFLIERLLESYKRAMERLRLGQEDALGLVRRMGEPPAQFPRSPRMITCRIPRLNINCSYSCII